VHYGHTCLSKTNTIPVYYVFDKYSFDFEQVSAQLDDLAKKYNENIIILYDLSYYHLYGKNELLLDQDLFVSIDKFFKDSLKKLENNRVFLTDIDLNDNQFITNKRFHESTDAFIPLNSRLIPKGPLQDQPNQVLFYYIGSNEKFLNLFQLYFNKMKFILDYYSNQNSNIEQNIKRLLMRRYYLIEKAKDAKIFGILIGESFKKTFKKDPN
jgi:diphthamide biosynthesis protein 2